jgi:hypothetical protein
MSCVFLHVHVVVKYEHVIRVPQSCSQYCVRHMSSCILSLTIWLLLLTVLLLLIVNSGDYDVT